MGYVLFNYVEWKNSLKKGFLVKNLKDILGFGKMCRKISVWDVFFMFSMDVEYFVNGSSVDCIYDFNILVFVKFVYVVEWEDELFLVKGLCVIVMEKCSDGWWWGSYNGQIGWFFFNYVLEEVDEVVVEFLSFLSLCKGVLLSNGQGFCVLYVVQMLYFFSLVIEEEFNFEKGEIMEVIEKFENDFEWWKCKNVWGQVGFVFKNYVVVFSDGFVLYFVYVLQISYIGFLFSGCFVGREWYYGNVMWYQVECVFNEWGVEGDFFIRDSEFLFSDFFVFFKVLGKNKYFKVQFVDNVYCIGQWCFYIMDELVEYYKKVFIFISEYGEKFYFVRVLQ